MTAGGPGGLEDCCFRAPCPTVATDVRGLASLLGAWTGSAAPALLSVACQHPCCPGDCPGPWSPISGECPRRMCDQVWARRAPGYRCFGRPLRLAEADVSPPSPRENRRGAVLWGPHLSRVPCGDRGGSETSRLARACGLWAGLGEWATYARGAPQTLPPPPPAGIWPAWRSHCLPSRGRSGGGA